jgi:hypothetical protein
MFLPTCLFLSQLLIKKKNKERSKKKLINLKKITIHGKGEGDECDE